MTSSQNHGFIVEDIIKQEFERISTFDSVPPPTVHTRYTARFDIPAHRDIYGKGMPTSIKSSKFKGQKTLVCLSDAVRICGLQDAQNTMRLVVALYKQQGQEKLVSEVREYLITPDEWRTLMGDVPVSVIEDFHDSLAQKDHKKARATAKEKKQQIADDYPSAMRWNAKIDSKNQRRLQCSVRLGDIEAAMLDKSRIRVFGQSFGPVPGEGRQPAYLKPKSVKLWGSGKGLPLRFLSPPRKRKPKAVPEPEVVVQAPSPASGRRPGRSMVK
jgi:hypothetical protein